MFRLVVLPLVLVLGLGPAGQVFCQRGCAVASPAPTAIAVAAACHGAHGSARLSQGAARCPQVWLSGTAVPATTRDGGTSPEQRMLVAAALPAAPPNRAPHAARADSPRRPFDRHPIETPLRI
jgi:hypothetical protein